MKKWFLYLTLALLVSCENIENGKTTRSIDRISVENPTTNVTEKLPFVGIRSFETRKGISGTGTPHRQVEIREDGTVVFSFEQINQAEENNIIKGAYNAGPFKKIMKCVFAEWDNEIRYYEITTNMIYETDKSGTRLNLEDCCEDGEGTCLCEGELHE